MWPRCRRACPPVFLLALLAVLPAVPGRADDPANPAKKPRLVVLVVFDQMRGDYLKKWKPLFGQGGFARLQNDGAWYANCHYPYANTQTGPGHASVLSGCSPDRHGIIANNWYDVKAGETVYCAGSPRYQRVPPEPKSESKEDGEATATKKPKSWGTPDRLLAPTFGDALKEATGGKAKVFGLSLKDRSALLPVGKKADGAYWLDGPDGLIITSTYYRDRVHPWVEDFNRKRVVDRWFDRTWDRSRADVDYEKAAGPDDVDGEGKGAKQGIAFPHATNGGLKKPGKAYYSALYNSPFGNELLLELAKAAVVAEGLGKDDVPDLLVVSFSSNDAIGHCWGPDSQEVLDVTLRSDRLMADLLKFLDGEVGKGNYVLGLTADHGICPLPEVSASRGKDAERLSPVKLVAAAELHLRQTFDKEVPLAEAIKTRWIESVAPPWIYLNQRLIADRGLKPADVEKCLADWLAKQPGIQRAFTRRDLAGKFGPDDPIGRRMQKSYFPERSGDVAVVIKPFCLLDGSLTGTNHGTPHPYDTHVPLLVYGPGIRPGTRTEEVPPQALAAIFAHALGIRPPATAEAKVPEGLFGR